MLASRLKPGDTLGIVSPSLPVLPEHQRNFDAGILHLKSLGFDIVLGQHVRSNTLGYGATPEQRAADINHMFADDTVDGILCSQGGVIANGCLPYLDWDMIKAHPKVFMGLSDITVLLVSLHKLTGLVTFHGNNVIRGFGQDVTAYDDEEFLNRVVHGRSGLVHAHTTRKTIRSGSASGKLIGGNLPCLLKLAGTPYFPDMDGTILFIEVLKTNPARCDHMFHQLKHMRVFDKITGIIVGYIDSLQNVVHPGIQMEDVLLNVIPDYSFPILKINDFGHNCPNTVLPIGTQAHLDADTQTITLSESFINN